MRRTMIIGAIGATALTIGLGVGSTLAASDPAPTTSTVTMTDARSGNHINNIEDMTSMMNGNGMTDMMDANSMGPMHTAMHQAVAGSVPVDVLAACDRAYDSMSDTRAPASTDGGSNHSAHHPGGQP